MSSKIVIKNLHQKSSSKIVIKNCHQKLSSKIVIKNRHKKSSSKIVIKNCHRKLSSKIVINVSKITSLLGHSVVLWRLWLLVVTDGPSKGQGHLLSCCGQLKMIVMVGWPNQHLCGTAKKPKNPPFFNIGCMNQHLHSSLQMLQQSQWHNDEFVYISSTYPQCGALETFCFGRIDFKL